MANYFYDGMQNVNERLNQLYAAFAAGPYNALPLTGGALSGPVTSTSFIAATALYAGNPAEIAKSALLPPPNAGQIGSDYESLRLGVAAIAGVATPGYFSFLAASGNGSATGYGYRLRLRTWDSGSGTWSLDLLEVGGNGQVVVPGVLTVGTVGSNLIPSTDNTRTLGSAALAYSVVYARTGAINTSDATLKRDFRNLTAAEIAAGRDLARAIVVYRWRDAVDEKGEAAREHIGPTVQRAIEIMQAHGLDPFNYGFICHDTWEQQTVEHAAIEAQPALPAREAVPEVLDATGQIVRQAAPAREGTPAVEARAAYTEITLAAGDRYAFRYDELAMFIAAGQEARLAALEAA